MKIMTPTPHKIYMDASLTPNRSLSPRAFTIVMSIVAGVSFLAGLMFVSMGAFPVIGFFGLDALAIWLAFRWSFRSLKQETKVRVTADTIDVEHFEAGKIVKTASIPTIFARVRLELPERRPSELQLAYQQQAWVIGRFLTPGERKGFKRALEDAIRRAKDERFEV
ncbi:MAG: DUF2244 domain-containing protein [Henriciella sp.]|jgi:uncharacterized membrane protein|nr:DUF2244 domain-containing protein [Henriciella sp.]